MLELLKNPNAVKAMKTKFRNPSRYDSWLKGVKSQAAGKAAGAGTDSAGAAGASSTGGAVANKTGVVKKSLPPRATQETVEIQAVLAKRNNLLIRTLNH